MFLYTVKVFFVYVFVHDDFFAMYVFVHGRDLCFCDKCLLSKRITSTDYLNSHHVQKYHHLIDSTTG